MKVAVVGCGAVGSFYGAKLLHAGADVHFLLRSDYEVVRRNGLSIKSVEGDFTVRPKCARLPADIGVSDLILIALKTTANHQFAPLLRPLVGPSTTLLTLQNGLGNEAQLAQLYSPNQIMGGLCFVCLNRLQPGVIHHIDHGLVVVGEYIGGPLPRTHAVADLFRAGGVPCTISDDLARAHWEKLTWNIPFNGLGVAGTAGYEAVVSGTCPPGLTPGPCCPTNQLLDGSRWETLVRELIREVIAAARAMGFELPDALVEQQIDRTRTMGAYKASTLIDFEKGLPLEMESLFLEPLRQAKSAGISMPRLENMCRVLTLLDRHPVRGRK